MSNQPKTTSPVSLRPATPDDFAQMAALEKLSYPEPWIAQHFVEESQKPYSRMLVLTDDETDTFIAGYIIYWIQVEGVSLLNINIHPDWRGLGFARKLMHAMINEAVRDEISRIVIEVREGNLSAIKLYESLGFTQTHTRPKFYQNGETAIVYEIKTSDVPNVIQ